METHTTFRGTNLSTTIGTSTINLFNKGIADTITETDLKLFLDPFRIKNHDTALYEALNDMFLRFNSLHKDVPPLEFLGCGFATNTEHKYAPPVSYELFSRADSLISLRAIPGIGFTRCSDVIAYLLLDYLVDYTNDQILNLRNEFDFQTTSTTIEVFNFQTMQTENKELTSVFHENSNLEKNPRLFIPIHFLTVSHELHQNKRLREIFFSDDTFEELCNIFPDKREEILILKINLSNASNKRERSKIVSEIIESYPEIEGIFHHKMTTNDGYHTYIAEQVLEKIKIGNLHISN